jgi:hypothetical protein
VFNTYGEHSNTDLLHMYGFVEAHPNNIFDSVEVPARFLIEAFRMQKNDPDEVISKKIEALFEIELIENDTSIVIGQDGVLNEEECLHILQVDRLGFCYQMFSTIFSILYSFVQIYSMNNDEFKEFLENGCELLEDEEWDSYSLLNGLNFNVTLLNICFYFYFY